MLLLRCNRHTLGIVIQGFARSCVRNNFHIWMRHQPFRLSTGEQSLLAMNIREDLCAFGGVWLWTTIKVVPGVVQCTGQHKTYSHLVVLFYPFAPSVALATV